MRTAVLNTIVAVSLIGCGKAAIEADCEITGLKEITCSWINKGTADGSKCFRPTLKAAETYFSSDKEICSGIVKSNDVRETKVRTTFDGKSLLDVCTKPIGEISCALAQISPEALQARLKEQSQKKSDKLAEQEQLRSKFERDQLEQKLSDSRKTDWTKDELVLRGAKVYSDNCIACHKHDGERVGPIKALNGSSIVLSKNSEQLILLMLRGSANRAMPSWKNLSDVELAAVLNYIQNSWGNMIQTTVLPPHISILR